MLLASALVARAHASEQSDYADSVDRALGIVEAAPSVDREAARRAADALETGTGDSQPEILQELRQDPPDLSAARARLTALSKAARSPAFTPEPTRASRALRDVLGQPRYAALHAGPSPGDRLRDLLLQLLVWAVAKVGGGGHAVLWLVAAAAAVGLGAVAFAVLGSVVGRRVRREARLAAAAAPQPTDRFAEADRLASAGDLSGAVRALAGAVAAALSPSANWDRSPLTIREIFSRSPEAASLRPLLIVFEAAAYGGRRPDRDAYERAAAVAAVFRQRPRAIAHPASQGPRTAA